MFSLALALAALAVVFAISPAASAQDATVAVADNQFSPATVTVNVGDTVTWDWTGANPHTVTSNDGTFDSGAPQTSGSFQHTFTAAGTFAYICEVHGQSMSGTVTVNAAPTGGQTPPSGAPSPTAGVPTARPSTGGGTPVTADPIAAPVTGTGGSSGGAGSTALFAALAAIAGLALVAGAEVVRRRA
jgi:plastocyanin